MEKFYSIQKVSSILGVAAQTLRNWDKSGKMKPHHTSASGYRYYTAEQVEDAMLEPVSGKLTIGYCISNDVNSLQKKIEKFQNIFTNKRKTYKIITDVGNAENFNRIGFEELLNLIFQNEVETVVVFDKKQLVKNGFELLEYIAKKYDCVIEIA